MADGIIVLMELLVDRAGVVLQTLLLLEVEQLHQLILKDLPVVKDLTLLVEVEVLVVQVFLILIILMREDMVE